MAIKERLLAEIDRGLEVYAGTDLMGHRALRALRREMERHSPEWKETYDGEIQIDRWQQCKFCRNEWPCPSIISTANEFKV